MRKIFTLYLFLGIGLLAKAQEQSITGTVKGSDSGETLIGVNILIKGSTTGTITDYEGNFSINVPTGTTLVFTYLGYADKEIQIGSQSVLNVVLEPTINELDEVIVVGYGVQNKSVITGSISRVEFEKLEKNQLRVEQALQGKIAGVNIMTESGAPGGGITMRIRGTGTNKNANPLFIVDGMRTGGIEYLNPNDIESIEVLKDAASAAIYGSEGANGVVLITTKSGNGSNGKSVISYNAYYGIQEAKNIHQVLNAEEYADYYRTGLRNEIIYNNLEFDIPESLLDKMVNTAYPFHPDTIGKGTDWMNEIFSIAPMQEHNISVTGGSKNTSLFFSGSLFNQEGVVGGDKSNFRRYTGRLNAEHKANDWFTIGSRISFTHIEKLDINENSEFGGVISNAMNIDPLTPVYYADTSGFPDKYRKQIYDNIEDVTNSSLRAPGDLGYYGMSEYVQNEIINPRAQIDNTHRTWSQDKIMANASATIEPIRGLKFKTVYDIDLAYGTAKSWTPEYYYHSINYNYLNSTGQYNEKHFTWQWENILTYNKVIDRHAFDLLAGTTARSYTFNYLNGFGEALQEESWDFAVLDAVLSDTTKRAATGGNRNWDNRLYSYFGRVQYNFDKKYLANLTLRSDASSKLSPANRTQYFPSVSLGWVLSRENFWNVSPINFAKLRFSWGRNGSAMSLGTLEYVSTIASTAESTYYLSGGSSLVGAEPAALSNSSLVWETSQQTDIGIDIRFYENKFTFTTDLYSKKTIELITAANFPEYVGNNKPSANAGDVTNLGIEIELRYRSNIGSLSYDIGANAAYNNNRVTSLTSPLIGANLGTSGAMTRMEEDMPVWYFYGYETDGIFNSFDEINAHANDTGKLIQPNAIPGDVKFRDLNDDGSINEDDKTFIGSPHPDWIFGFSANVYYKWFDLALSFQGALGAEVYYGVYRNDVNNNNKPTFFYDNAWTPETLSQEFPRYTITDMNNNFAHSDLFIFNGSYLRMQNIELGYTLPRTITNKIQITKLRAYVSGRNLFVISKYPSGDPEIGNSNGGEYKTSIGVDRGMYPRPRIISFGINVTL